MGSTDGNDLILFLYFVSVFVARIRVQNSFLFFFLLNFKYQDSFQEVRVPLPNQGEVV